jgi:hypothetical protein
MQLASTRTLGVLSVGYPSEDATHVTAIGRISPTLPRRSTMTQYSAAELTLSSDRSFSRIGATAAFLGVLIYFTAAVLHPGTPPHETRAAFHHYAQEPWWGVIHLAELLGVLLMSSAALALSWKLRTGRSCAWAVLGGAAMVVLMAVYTVFAAVDGVALGVLVRRLAAAGSDDRVLFEAAFAVRQVEAGLFALQWFMFAVATALYVPAFLKACAFGNWNVAMAALSALASLGALMFAVVQAQTGFTEASMMFQAGLYVGVVWMLAVGIYLLRSPVAEPTGRQV